ncbi:MAG: tetratricopeptide repeat protein [Pyrinomonadaceae bacterium]
MRYVACLLSLLLLLQAAPARRAAGIHLKRGDLLMSQNKVIEALASYDKAVEADPAWATSYVKRGMARRAKGDLDGSIEDYEKAGTLDPRSTANNASVAESYGNRGLNKLTRLEIDAAVADFTKAITHDGKEPNHFFRRGQARLVNEEFEEAVADFNRAEALNRGHEFLTTLIYAERGYVMLLQGKRDEAKMEFDKCDRLASGQKFQLRLHLMGIETQIEERRRRRADSLKGVT